MAPIPRLVLSTDYGDMLDLDDWLSELPIISEVLVPEKHASLNEWINFARRGFFAFDWSDVHFGKKLFGYERIAAPTRPLHVSELRGFLQNCATVATIPEADFHRDAVVKLPSFMGAVRPERYMD